MVLGTPIDLGTMRAALITRCQLDPTDPRAQPAVLNPMIAEAVQRFDVGNPQIWPWDFVTGTPVTIDTTTTDPFTWAMSTKVAKVRYALLGDTAGTWQYPLERVTRAEQLDRFPLDSDRGVPRTFAIQGFNDAGANGEPTVAMYLRPQADVPYKLTVAGYLPIPVLTADTDPISSVNDYQIDDWSVTVIEYAAHLVYRAREDLSEAVSCKQSFDQDVLELRRYARRTIGPGIPGRPLADDPDLQPL